MVELTILGISLQGEGGAPILLLHPHGTERILSLSIGPTEAFAISSVLNAPERVSRAEFAAALSMEQATSPDGQKNLVVSRTAFLPQASSPEGGALFPRPMTHDLTLSLVYALGSKLLGVELLRVVDGIFLAEAVLAAGSTLVRVDCRPSDGVALALRCGAAIRATDAVLAYAEDIADVMNILPEHVRLLASARMSEPREPSNARKDTEEAPSSLAMQAALAVRNSFLEATRKKDAAQKERRLAHRFSAPDARDATNESPLPDLFSPAASLKSPRENAASGSEPGQEKQVGKIRVALVRQTGAGHLKIMNEFHVPLKAAPAQGQAAEPDPLAGAEQRFKGAGTEEDRWAALLKVLSPETKLLM